MRDDVRGRIRSVERPEMPTLPEFVTGISAAGLAVSLVIAYLLDNAVLAATLLVVAATFGAVAMAASGALTHGDTEGSA